MPASKNANPALKPTKKSAEPNYVLVIHGGAGTMSRQGSTPEKRATYRAALSQALKAGYGVLKQGGEAMDAVVAAVSVMEGGIYTKSRCIVWLMTGFQI
jgi:beta-aspartyl-peptidase (threonine type)